MGISLVIRIGWNSFCFFVIWLYNFTGNCWIIHNTCYIISIFTTAYSRISNIYIFSHTWRFLHWYRHLLLFYQWSELHFFPIKSNLHLHDISFAKIFDVITHVIMLNALRFKSSVLFGTHTLLDKSLRVLQFPKFLIQLWMDSSEILDCIHIKMDKKFLWQLKNTNFIKIKALFR